jgi:hypothetical protein
MGEEAGELTTEGTRSGRDGEFHLAGLFGDQVVLCASRYGYQDFECLIRFENSRRRKEYDIVLQPIADVADYYVELVIEDRERIPAGSVCLTSRSEPMVRVVRSLTDENLARQLKTVGLCEIVFENVPADDYTVRVDVFPSWYIRPGESEVSPTNRRVTFSCENGTDVVAVVLRTPTLADLTPDAICVRAEAIDPQGLTTRAWVESAIHSESEIALGTFPVGSSVIWSYFDSQGRYQLGKFIAGAGGDGGLGAGRQTVDCNPTPGWGCCLHVVEKTGSSYQGKANAEAVVGSGLRFSADADGFIRVHLATPPQDIEVLEGATHRSIKRLEVDEAAEEWWMSTRVVVCDEVE